MDTKEALDLAEKFILSFNKSKREFIDARSREWGERIFQNFAKRAPNADQNDPRSEIRMALLGEITREIATYCRRDERMSDTFAESRWEKFRNLDRMRAEDGVTPVNHPTILALKAELSFLCKDFDAGRTWIEKAMAANEAHPFKLRERERIRLACLKARALYACGQYDEAIAVSDKAVGDVEKYSRSQEESDLALTCTKGFGSVPVGMYALFAACDVRVNRPDWHAHTRFQEEFTFFWNKSMVDYSAPASWNPPLQIAVLTDENWSKRVDEYVKVVAEDLYVHLGTSHGDKLFRRVRAFWAGLPMGVPAGLSSRAAAALLVILILATAAFEVRADTRVSEAIPVVALVVERSTDRAISADEVSSFLSEALENEGEKSIEDLETTFEKEIWTVAYVDRGFGGIWRPIDYHGEGTAESV